MLNERSVFILGNSLLTNGIMRMLQESPQFTVLGCAELVEEAFEIIGDHIPDAFIVMGIDDQTTIRICPVLARYPDVPILRADISQDHIRLVTSEKIEATPSELLAAITKLPGRSL